MKRTDEKPRSPSVARGRNFLRGRMSAPARGSILRGYRIISSAFLLFPLLLAPTPGSAQSRPSYDRVDIGAFDPDAWNGIEFLAQAFHQPANFALRVGSQSAKSGGTFVEGADINNDIGEVG